MSVIGKRIIVTDADYEDIAINRGVPTRTITVNITNGAYSGDSTITEGTTAQIVLTANTGYKLPNSISVTAADYTYNENTGVIVLSNPNEDITISAVCQEIGQAYTITTTIDNDTYTGDTQVYDGETAYVTISANEGYRLPHTITVVGATSSYDRATGIISLTNPTSNVTITGECEEIAGGIPELVQGYWSDTSSLGALSNRVCNETLIQGIQTVTTKPGYVIRAVFAYTQPHTWEVGRTTRWEGVLFPAEAATSTSRTTYTTLNANYYYGFTFAKTDANANILPSEDIIESWVKE